MNKVRDENNNTLAEWDTIYSGELAERWTIWRDDRLVSLFASHLPKNAHVLDVGSGNGLAPRFIWEKRPDLRFSVSDFSPISCNYMSDLLFPWQSVTCADLNQPLPFEDGQFDVVMCSEVLEHTDNPEASVKELIRISSNMIAITVPLENATDSKYHLWSLNVDDITRWFATCPRVHIQTQRERRILVCFASKILEEVI